MPTYTYRCEKRDCVFDQFHGMNESIDTCGDCGSPVKRVVSNSSNVRRLPNFGKKKAGSLVKQYIKDVKEEIKHEKKRILEREYETK